MLKHGKFKLRPRRTQALLFTVRSQAHLVGLSEIAGSDSAGLTYSGELEPLLY